MEAQVVNNDSVRFQSECTVNRRYMTDIFRDLDAQRKDEHSSLCDVILRADGRKFPAHRCILAATSDYFRSMFYIDRFSESAKQEVELHSISSEALEIILETIYTGNLKLNIDNVYSIVAAADHLMLSDVKGFCDNFLREIIKSTDPRAVREALKIKRSAELYNLGELNVMAEKVISTHFEIVVTTDDFKDLGLREVRDLLSSDEMQKTSEEVLWEAAVTWLKHDLSSRSPNTDILMQVIRFPLIDPKYLISTVRPHPVMTSIKCQKYVQEAVDYHLIPEERCFRQTTRTKPRCTTETTVVYCLASAKHFLCFLPHKDQWYALQAPFQTGVGAQPAELGEPVASGSDGVVQEEEFFYGLLSVGGYIFVRSLSRSREQVGNFALRRIQMYSITTNAWTECSLPEVIQFAILIECNGTLYSCSRKGIEAYSPERDQWSTMHTMTMNPCQFAVSDQKRIYLFNLEDGGIEIIHTDKQFQSTKNQMMWLSRFDVLSLAKLNNHDVFLSLRTSTGVLRKIVNVRTNHWQDANKRMCHGVSPVNPKQGVSYPHCLNLEDPWEITFDRNKNEMFVLAKWSAISDCPVSHPSKSGTAPKRHADAVLPFFKIDASKAWRRQASLPEGFVGEGSTISNRQAVQLCISDGQTSMATSLP